MSLDALTTTFQPRLANSRTVAAPMPDDEPLTTQTLRSPMARS
jgi:hypothetical protein